MLFLNEDEGKKLGKKQLIMPKYVIDHLMAQQKLYSGKKYKNTKGYKRLNGLLNKSYNDPARNKQKQHNNNYTISFADAKRIDFDMRNMDQSEKNIEYMMIGDNVMRDWVHNSLDSLRNSIHKVSEVPEVPKLNNNDIKPNSIPKPANVNGLSIKIHN